VSSWELTPNFGLDELELDALTEVVNIGVSRAAASLRDMVGEQVFLSVPSVAITSPSRAAELIGERETSALVAVRQGFQGEFSGSALLIFPEKNSLELVRAVAGTHLSLEDILELEQEALAEIGNVILNGCMATIANLLQRRLTISLPEIVTGSAEELFQKSPSLLRDVVLFIHIDFNVKGRELSGYVAMVMDLPSLESLKTLVGEFIQRTTT
jgi:chemotaxis protein CheC